MTLNTVVSDTGPLISLEKLSSGYGWVQQLYGQILIPEAVAEELYQGMFSSWEAYRSHYGLGNFVAVVEVADGSTNLAELLKAGRIGKKLYAGLLEALD